MIFHPFAVLDQDQCITFEVVEGRFIFSFNSQISTKRSFVSFQHLKLYVMFIATHATSAAIDFLKENVEDGVVDSLPSKGSKRMPIYSSYVLKGSPCAPLRDCSSSPIYRPSTMPQQ